MRGADVVPVRPIVGEKIADLRRTRLRCRVFAMWLHRTGQGATVGAIIALSTYRRCLKFRGGAIIRITSAVPEPIAGTTLANWSLLTKSRNYQGSRYCDTVTLSERMELTSFRSISTQGKYSYGITSSAVAHRLFPRHPPLSRIQTPCEMRSFRQETLWKISQLH